MVFAGSGITYSELKEMDLREYREAVEALEAEALEDCVHGGRSFLPDRGRQGH